METYTLYPKTDYQKELIRAFSESEKIHLEINKETPVEIPQSHLEKIKQSIEKGEEIDSQEVFKKAMERCEK